MKRYLAIDIGASSGRHIVGWMENGEIKTDEVYRFYNGVTEENGHLVWNIEALTESVIEGIAKAFEKYPNIERLAIDTWGCDYVLLCGDEALLPVYAYRDARTQEAVEAVHGLVPFEALFARTGIAFQSFNTVYQLYADKTAGRLSNATDFLMMPEYLSYKLTGVKKKEYTAATTTGLVNAQSQAFDGEIVQKLGLPQRLFAPLSPSGAVVGALTPAIAKRVGGQLTVVLCASHDTASAVEGIPMVGNELYISSGTWSLLGVKEKTAHTDKSTLEAEFSNEGGVGYVRFQKNIMGMWIVNRLRDELCPNMPFGEIVDAARRSTFSEIADVNAPVFLAPARMSEAFDGVLGRKPACAADYFACAYKSLAACYARSIADLERALGKTYTKLYIVGGGAKNAYLNELTAKATGKEVIALPIEATALGNLKVQMRG